MKKNEMLDTDEAQVGNGKDLQVFNNEGIGRLALLEPHDIDLLETAEKSPIELLGNYWTPETPGETKRVIFDRIDTSPVLNSTTGEIIQLECAYFFVKEDGSVKQLLNGSKRLVGALQTIPRGTPLEIKYLGKKVNSTNSFKSDNWSCVPLIAKPNSK